MMSFPFRAELYKKNFSATRRNLNSEDRILHRPEGYGGLLLSKREPYDPLQKRGSTDHDKVKTFPLPVQQFSMEEFRDTRYSSS